MALLIKDDERRLNVDRQQCLFHVVQLMQLYTCDCSYYTAELHTCDCSYYTADYTHMIVPITQQLMQLHTCDCSYYTADYTQVIVPITQPHFT